MTIWALTRARPAQARRGPDDLDGLGFAIAGLVVVPILASVSPVRGAGI